MLTVAIIDDGVSSKVISDLCFDLCISKAGDIVANTAEIPDTSHGSICAAIIRTYAHHARIGSIKILDTESRRGNCAALISALDWCVERKLPLVHLSLGSSEPRDYLPLLDAVNRAYSHGVVIVAACKNGKSYSYPAAFNQVIGVSHDAALVDNQYAQNKYPNGGIDFLASSAHQVYLIPQVPRYVPPLCNSYAAPVITAHVSTVMEESNIIDFNQIRNRLYEMIPTDGFEHCLRTFDGADNNEFLVFNQEADITQNSARIYLLDAVNKYSINGQRQPLPIVGFYGENALQYIHHFSRWLFNHNYKPILFSETKSHFFAGLYYLPSREMLSAQCLHLAEDIGGEIILAVFSEVNKSEETSIDILVSCGTTKALPGINYEMMVDANRAGIEETCKQLADILI